jgi:hypothetical protein
MSDAMIAKNGQVKRNLRTSYHNLFFSSAFILLKNIYIMMLNTFILICLSTSLVSASDFALRILLNKGQTLPTGESCTGAEWSSILSTIDATINSRRRNLRRLPQYPAWCEQKCVGFADGTCIGRHPSCNGYRELNGQEESNAADTPKSYDRFYNNVRDLFSSTTCQGQIDELNTALNNLEPTLSSQCQAVLDSQREFTYLTTINNCDIQRIRLMNADTDTVMVEDFKNGMSFRRSGPRVTFEAINDSCVCNVQFNIKNSAGQIIHSRFEFYRPFVAFSNSVPNAQGVVDLYGARFGIGSYTLEYYPDNDTSKTLTIAFTVIA